MILGLCRLKQLFFSLKNIFSRYQRTENAEHARFESYHFHALEFRFSGFRDHVNVDSHDKVRFSIIKRFLVTLSVPAC